MEIRETLIDDAPTTEAVNGTNDVELTDVHTGHLRPILVPIEFVGGEDMRGLNNLNTPTLLPGSRNGIFAHLIRLLIRENDQLFDHSDTESSEDDGASFSEPNSEPERERGPEKKESEAEEVEEVDDAEGLELYNRGIEDILENGNTPRQFQMETAECLMDPRCSTSSEGYIRLYVPSLPSLGPWHQLLDPLETIASTLPKKYGGDESNSDESTKEVEEMVPTDVEDTSNYGDLEWIFVAKRPRPPEIPRWRH